MDNFFKTDELINEMVSEIDFTYPTLTFDKKGFLTIECAWRLLDDINQIITGDYELKDSMTKEKTEKKLRDNLINKRILRILLLGQNDLEITFDNNYKLQVINNSGLYEGWKLKIVDKNYFTMPGGELSGY